jgi:tripartite ATP-independent transporter DctM subunit
MTDPFAIGLVGLAALATLIALRMPIAYAMILTGGIGVSLLDGPGVLLSQLKTLAYGQFSIYDLSVVPMFVLMGALASASGLSASLFRGANAWFGRFRGGTAMAAVAACAGFGAVCGSSLATASTMGKVALPELRRAGCSGALATGTLAAGGVLGILIPPSVVLVLYAVIVEANIVTMFMAAFIPGFLAVAFFLVTIAIYVRVNPEAGPAGEAVGSRQLVADTVAMAPVAAIFGIVIGGIYLGLYNPTPAAAVGAALVWLHGAITGALRWRQIRAALLETASISGMIYLILLGAEMLKVFMSRGGVPQAVADAMLGSELSPLFVLVLLLAALIVLGCLMDSLSMILLAIPFFWPVLVALNGGDAVIASEAGFGMTTDDLKIWFGILALVVVELGLITPPVGMNVFVISGIARDVPMRETFLGVMPFFGAEVLRVGMLIAFPALVLWFPHWMVG